MIQRPVLTALTLLFAFSAHGETTRFCLEGEFDLGARYQGTHPQAGEFYSSSWCIVSDDETERVMFAGAGQSNPDLDGSWTVMYLPPDRVRIVNRDAPPDIAFNGTNNTDEAQGVRRIDPRRFVGEYKSNPARFEDMAVDIQNGRLQRVQSSADLPLRGRVPVIWEWDWSNLDAPRAQMSVDGTVMFRATGSWETLSNSEAEATWSPTPGANPVDVPGDRWPARVAMRLVKLTDGVHLVKGVRTSFQHLVVETSEGLVVGDAPAGWVELHQLPPADLVPGLGVSGLSELLIDFLKHEFEGRNIAAVVVTHFHDDHAGGARAFAAEGAAVYAPAGSAGFLERALDRQTMPPDRLVTKGLQVDVLPVSEATTIGAGSNRVRLVPLGPNPHVDAMLGIWVVDRDYFFVSDVHVPGSDAEAPTELRAKTECWFAAKAVELLPESVLTVNSHSAVITPATRLAAYLESDVCRNGVASDET